MLYRDSGGAAYNVYVIYCRDFDGKAMPMDKVAYTNLERAESIAEIIRKDGFFSEVWVERYEVNDQW